jgi:hypothetical protein
MGNIIGNMAKAATVLVGVPVAALFAYDTIAVRPYLAQIREILAQADPQDASPPAMIRELIDANAGSPTPYATRLVTSRIFSGLSQNEWRVRELLWQVLLPMHLEEFQMYGLYATLSYNGTDYGLSSFARREYGEPLSQLTPVQAANTVAITQAPTIYIRNRGRLAQRAKLLLDRSGHAP